MQRRDSWFPFDAQRGGFPRFLQCLGQRMWLRSGLLFIAVLVSFKSTQRHPDILSALLSQWPSDVRKEIECLSVSLGSAYTRIICNACETCKLLGPIPNL